MVGTFVSVGTDVTVGRCGASHHHHGNCDESEPVEAFGPVS